MWKRHYTHPILTVLILLGSGLFAQAQSGDEAPLAVYHVNITDFRIIEDFTWDSQKGAYIMSRQEITGQHQTWTDGAMSSSKLPPDNRTKVAGEDPNQEASLYRQNNLLELKLSIAGEDPKTGRPKLSIQSRRLKLTRGTLENFDAGQTVETEVANENDAINTMAIFGRLTEDFFVLMYGPAIERQGLYPETQPTYSGKNPRPTKVILSKEKISVIYEIESFLIDAKIYGKQPTFLPPVVPKDKHSSILNQNLA